MNNVDAEQNLKLLNILTFLSGFRTYEGVLAIFFATVSGSFALGMTIFAVINLSASFFEIPTGILSDNIGRKKTLLIYYFSGAVAVLIFHLAQSTPVLLLGAITLGFSAAMRSGAISAFVYENLDILGIKDEFKKVEGRRSAIGRYSLVVAGVVGAIIIYLSDIRTAIFLTWIVLVGAFLVSFWLRDIDDFELKKANVYADLSKAWNSFVHDPVLRDLSLGRMIARGAGNVEYRFRALFFAMIMPEWLVNLVGILNNLISGIAMQWTHRVVYKLGILRSLVHIDVLDRFVVSGLVLLNTITSGVIMNITTSIAYGIREIAAEDLLQLRYSKDQRATMGSLVGLGGGLVYGVAAILVGLLADHIGLLNTMLLMQPILLISSFFFYRGIKLATATNTRKGEL